MPLQFRRGTNAERLTITPATGEPIWTTNTNRLYIGDGTTVGGVAVEIPLPSTGTFVSLTVTNLHFSGDPVGVNQTTAWTGTVASSQITSVSTSKVTGLSVVGYTNNYNDLNNKPAPFNLSTVTNQALFTTSSVTFANVTATNSLFVNDTGSLIYSAPPNNVAQIWAVSNNSVAVRALLDNYSSSPAPFYNGRAGRGTAASPSAVQTDDNLVSLRGNGYGTTGFQTTSSGFITISAAENFTDTTRGTKIQFYTAPIGQRDAVLAAVIRGDGVFINTTATNGTGMLTINGTYPNTTYSGVLPDTLLHGLSKTPNQAARITLDAFGNETATTTPTGAFSGRRSQGTVTAPTAVQAGDILARLNGYGYGSTGYINTSSALVDIVAAENFTDSAAGGKIQFKVQQTGNIGTSTQIAIATVDQNGLTINSGSLKFPDTTVQTTAWTGSISTSSVNGLKTIAWTGKLSDGTGQISTSTVAGLSTIGYTGKLSDGTGQISTSTVNGLSIVGYTNNYNDLNNLPTIPGAFNLSTVTNQALFTTSTVKFQGLAVTTGTTVNQVVSAGGYPLDSNGQALITQSSTQTVAMIVSNYTGNMRGQLSVRSYGQNIPGGTASTVAGAQLVLEASRGTGLAPTATGNGDSTGAIQFGGYDGTNWLFNQSTSGVSQLAPATIFATASEAWANNGTTTTNAGSALGMRLQPVGTQLNSTSRRIFMLTSWTAGSTTTNSPPILTLAIGQGVGDAAIPTLTPAASVGSFGTGSGRVNMAFNNNLIQVFGVPAQDTAPDNATITATNVLSFITGRRNAFSGRRDALVSGDTVFSVSGNAQTAANGSGNGSQVGFMSLTALENAGASARGTQFVFQTVNTGTTTLATRQVLQDRNSQYNSDTHTFREKSGTFTALSMTTATAVFTAIPVVPNYTAAQANAITGQIGAMIAISNSAGVTHPNGMIAFWDTTNSRWSYVQDNSAV